MRENRCGWKTATTRRGLERAGGGDRGADLGRVVRVVVDHLGAAGRGPDPLEPPAGAAEVGERGGGGRGVGAGERAGGERGRGVAGVVDARDRQRHGHAGEAEARAAGLERDVLRPRDVAGEALEVRLVAEDDLVGHVEEGAERVVDVALGRVRRVVVELGVREHGDPRRELEQRAVRLVGLDHEPLPRPPAGVGAGRADLAADQVAGIEAAAAQRVHDHARGRRLAVRPGHRDRRPQARDLAEQVGAVQLTQAALARRHALRVVRRDRARDDDLGALGDVRGIVPGRRHDPGRPQVRRVGRPVGASHFGAECACDDGEAAHPGAADADEVQPPAGPWRGVGHPAATLAAQLRAARYQPPLCGQPPLPGLVHVRTVLPEPPRILNGPPPPAPDTESTEISYVSIVPVTTRPRALAIAGSISVSPLWVAPA